MAHTTDTTTTRRTAEAIAIAEYAISATIEGIEYMESMQDHIDAIRSISAEDMALYAEDAGIEATEQDIAAAIAIYSHPIAIAYMESAYEDLVDQEASDIVATIAISAIAEANPKAVSKDIDALLEMGEVDSETVWTGYLWDAVVAEVGDMDEDTEMALSAAIVDYYCDQMDGWDEDMEEAMEEAVAEDVAEEMHIRERWEAYCEGEISLTSDLLEDVRKLASDLLATGRYIDAEDAMDEAIWMVAGAN